MDIIAVVVTYNRLALLKECLSAVQGQTLPLKKIIVVDNHSTDGTTDYLATLKENPLLRVVTLPENIGGAGGFSRGIKEAVLEGAAWVWCMDDDTVPEKDAIEKLAKALSLPYPVGFVCSKVLWTDGTPHKMNTPSLYISKGDLFNSCSTKDIPAFPVRHASFVSIMVSAEAVRKVGLPIAAFFIWGDDMEFTQRISAAGYRGFYIDNSVVWHKTASNTLPHPDTVAAKEAWKFYYQARNISFMKRQHKGRLSFYLSTLNMYRVYMHRINKRKDGKTQFKAFVRKGCLDGLRFNPEIEFVED